MTAIIKPFPFKPSGKHPNLDEFELFLFETFWERLEEMASLWPSVPDFIQANFDHELSRPGVCASEGCRRKLHASDLVFATGSGDTEPTCVDCGLKTLVTQICEGDHATTMDALFSPTWENERQLDHPPGMHLFRILRPMVG